MAIGQQSDFVIYQEQFFGGMTEVLQQNAQGFNAASRNALRLVPRLHRGEYLQESFITSLSALISARDLTSVAAATDQALVQAEHTSVKINRKLGPVAQTLNAWRKIERSPEDLSFYVGQQAAQAVLEDYLNTALLAAEGALDANADIEHDATAATIQTADLIDGLSKFGDRGQRIVAWVMHSKVYYDLVKDQIADNIFDLTGAVVRSGAPVTVSRPVIVTDSPALIEADGVATGVDAYSTLGLVADGVVVMESEQRDLVSEVVTGLEQLVGRIQGEHAFTLGLKGYTWDTANGGANPDDTAVALGTNWDQVATSDKDTAGVIIKSR